jgi:hypothetical protein
LLPLLLRRALTLPRPSPNVPKFRKLACRGRFVLRQSRLNSGLAQVFLAVFALLATFAPGFDAPLPGNEAGEYVSAPADPRSDGTNLVRATLGVAEDLEEEADEEEATSLVLSALRCDAPAAYRAAGASQTSVRWLSAHFCTGPPTL